MAAADQAPAKSGHIRGFDGLRAFSILFVVLTHYGLYEHLPQNAFLRERVWQLCSGVTGVNIFFGLSGFLITRLLLQEQDRKGGIGLKRFYVRRFLRLTPPFVLFFVLLGVCVLAGRTTVRPLGALISFFYLYNYIPHFMLDGRLTHTWSLAVEEQFYLLWPFLMTRLPRPWLLRAALVLIGIAVTAAFVLPQIVLHHNGHAYPLPVLSNITHWFFPAAGPIMVGALSSVIERSHPVSVGRLIGTRSVLLLAGSLFAAPLYLPGPLLPFSAVLQALGVSLLLLRILHRQDSPLTRALELRPLAYIGKISYGIYIYHVLIIGSSPAGAMIHSVPLSLAVFMGLAIASYELYERPILRLKDRFH